MWGNDTEKTTEKATEKATEKIAGRSRRLKGLYFFL